MVLDDIFTTGMNTILAAEDIQREGGIVSSCLAIFDYGFSISGRNFSQKSFKAYATTQFPIFLGLAQRPEYDQLSFEEAQELLLWYEGIQKSFG